ncbi:MAG: PspA/IM30 family protein [Myxococcota bacterium]|nr:PspA/IM30 family protein [Myxococcota bacterium]
MGRLFRIIKGWFLRLIGSAEDANPRAILEAEIADFHKASAQYNQNLAKQAGMIERLKGQIASEGKKLEMLTARATAAFKAGNTEKAGQMALQIKEVTRELEENKSQLLEAEDIYQNLMRQREVYTKEARARIDKIKSKISRVEMAEAQAKLTEAMTDANFNSDGTGLSSLEDKLDERIANAQGKVRVATEMSELSDFSVTEAEQSALEQQALAEFAAQMGLAAASPPVDAAPPARELGPAEPEQADEVGA